MKDYTINKVRNGFVNRPNREGLLSINFVLNDNDEIYIHLLKDKNEAIFKYDGDLTVTQLRRFFE